MNRNYTRPQILPFLAAILVGSLAFPAARWLCEFTVWAAHFLKGAA